MRTFSTGRVLFVSLLCLPGAEPLLADTVQLLASSYSHDRIMRIDLSSGAVVGYIGQGVLNMTTGMALGPDGLLYVANAQRVSRFNVETGAYLDDVLTNCVVQGQIGFGPNGMLYLCRNWAGKVSRYDPASGEFIDDFASGGLTSTYGLTFDPDGLLYVSGASSEGGAVARYDPQSGAYVDTFLHAADLDAPFGVAFGPDGNLLVSNTNRYEVMRYSGQDGTFLGLFTSGISTPQGILIDGGQTYIANISAVNEYDYATGGYVRSIGFLGDLTSYVAVVLIPEPNAGMLLVLALPVLFRVRRS